jgi:rSAM/selenodomain-associated transferase 2
MVRSRRPALSIVIPMLNESAFAVASLTRLDEFRKRGAEVIVVDGGSNDGSAGLAAPYADRVIVASCGRARQMNEGAAAASGDALLFLHMDTRLPPNGDLLVATMLEDPAVGWGHFDVNIAGDHPLLRLIAWCMNRRSRWTGIATGDQAIFVRRDWFDAAGGFPEIALMEDVALSKILRARARPVVIGARVATSGRRWERHGVVRTIFLMWWLRLRYFLGAKPEKLATHYEPN